MRYPFLKEKEKIIVNKFDFTFPKKKLSFGSILSTNTKQQFILLTIIQK
jgi:hypothetical protein